MRPRHSVLRLVSQGNITWALWPHREAVDDPNVYGIWLKDTTQHDVSDVEDIKWGDGDESDERGTSDIVAESEEEESDQDDTEEEPFTQIQGRFDALSVNVDP